jgi:hypothetical protein
MIYVYTLLPPHLCNFAKGMLPKFYIWMSEVLFSSILGYLWTPGCYNKCGHCTTAVGVSEALYAKAVSPDLLTGNRWGWLMCVGTECPYMCV